MLTRRRFITTGGLTLAGLALPRRSRAADLIEIHMSNNASRVKAWFEPVGLHITPGQTVRWILDTDVHSTAAYHPKNAMHSLRIPDQAPPWDSGLMTAKGAHFDVTFTVEGVYDYFCAPHEMAGMVGRLVVGRPGGPGAQAIDNAAYARKGWRAIPPAAQAAFPSVDAIVAKGIVRPAGITG